MSHGGVAIIVYVEEMPLSVSRLNNQLRC